jgi:hypothetical protein
VALIKITAVSRERNEKITKINFAEQKITILKYMKLLIKK